MAMPRLPFELSALYQRTAVDPASLGCVSPARARSGTFLGLRSADMNAKPSHITFTVARNGDILA